MKAQTFCCHKILRGGRTFSTGSHFESFGFSGRTEEVASEF